MAGLHTPTYEEGASRVAERDVTECEDIIWIKQMCSKLM